MYIYLNELSYKDGLLTLLKAFYPFEVFELTTYKQSTFGFVISTDQISVAYFYEKNLTLEKCVSKNELMAIAALEGKAKASRIRVQLRGLTYDLLAQVTGIQLPWGILMGIRPTKLALKLYKTSGDYDSVKETLCKIYRLAPAKADLLIEVIQTEQPFLINNEESHSIYIGIPFCPSKCSYCTFPSYRSDQWPEAYASYTEVLIQELEAGKDWFKRCTSVYIGGGTPTSLAEPDFEALIKKVRGYLGQRQVEWTVEAGRPDSITKAKLEAMANFGVTRISINPQTMQGHTLERIGRNHQPEDIVNCFKMARDMGFDHINMDLILGLPGEKLVDIKRTFEALWRLDPESITVHTLAFKRGSKLSEAKEKYLSQGAEELQKCLEFVEKTMKVHGYIPYYLYRQKQMIGQFENIGYCKIGCENIYNIRIIEEVESIVAFGAGAISKRVTSNKIQRLEQPKDVRTYLKKIEIILQKKKDFFA